MQKLSLESCFVAVWVLACLLLVSGVVAAWIFRIPGTTRSDFTNGPKGQHAPRFLHTAADTLRLVRPERRKLVYGLQLAGASIAALAIVGLFLAAFILQETNE